MIIECPSDASLARALSHTHWQSVGSAVRTILSDEPVRPQHISLLQHLSRAHDFDQGLLADPDAFVRLTQLVSTQIETSTAGRPLVNLIERFSAALDHIVSSGTVSKHYDRFVDNSGHLRLFTKQVRNRALQFIKQAGAPLRDTVAAVTALVKLGPCLTTTTMTNDDSTLNWLFSCASSEASGTLLNDILRFHFGGLLPAFIARESSPLVASALASALPYQPSMLVHRHMTSIIVVALKALLSENSSVTSSARSILSCVVITPQQQLWKDVHFLLNAPTYYHRCDGARLVTRYVAEHLPVDTSLLVATKLLLSHDYDEIVLAMAPRLKLDQAQPDNVKAFLFALTSGHVHLSAIWNLFASHPDNVGIIVKHAAAGDCGGDAVIAIASVPSARVKVVDLLLSPLYEDLRQGSPGREESDHLVESLSSPVPASQRPFVPISLVRSLLHSSNWSELRHHFGAIAAWALLNGGSEADLVVSLIAARLSNATNSGKQSLPDEVMREVGTWCITGLSGAIRCRDSARMTTCLTLYCRLPSPPAAMLHLLCCLQLELDALDRLQWYAASAPPDGMLHSLSLLTGNIVIYYCSGALNVMNALIGCAHSSTSADDLRIMFAAACSVLHCNSSPLCCSALRLAQICLRSGFLSDLHCVSDLVRDFTGIQPLLIQGAFDSECEASVRELLLTLGDHKVPQRIADSTSWRHLTTTMCFLPWLCLGSSRPSFCFDDVGITVSAGAGDKDRRKEPGRLTALSHLTRILSEPAPHLSHVFAEHLSEVQSDGADVDVQAERLLHESCRRLVEAFFPEFTSACAGTLPCDLLHCDGDLNVAISVAAFDSGAGTLPVPADGVAYLCRHPSPAQRPQRRRRLPGHHRVREGPAQQRGRGHDRRHAGVGLQPGRQRRPPVHRPAQHGDPGARGRHPQFGAVAQHGGRQVVPAPPDPFAIERHLHHHHHHINCESSGARVLQDARNVRSLSSGVATIFRFRRRRLGGAPRPRYGARRGHARRGARRHRRLLARHHREATRALAGAGVSSR